MKPSFRNEWQFRGVASSVVCGGSLAVVAMYWVFGVMAGIGALRAVLGTALLTLLPGGLLALFLGVEARNAGRFLVYAVSFSVGLSALLAVLVSLMGPAVGIAAPLTPETTGLLATAPVLVLTGLVYAADHRTPRAVASGPFPVLVGLTLLPGLAAVAALLMNRFGTNAGMWVLLAAIGVVVALTATSYVPRSLYSVTVFSVALATLLHKNLLTGWVVGADIQALASVAEQVSRAGVWSPQLGDSGLAVVTAVPAVIAGVSGLGVQAVFKLVYPLLFSFVPLGVYYVGTDVFDAEAGLYGGLLLTFYHVSFTFTPGKQLLSELFLVSLLLALRASGDGRKIAVGLPMAGLVLSHYGATYATGVALLFAAVAVWVVRAAVPDTDQRLRVGHPVALLVAGTAWYAATAPSTLSLLLSLPGVALGQLGGLLTGGPSVGTGASYVGGQTTLLERFNVALYALVTALLVLGLGASVWRTLDRLRRGQVPENAGYIAMAVPLLALLAMSFVLTLNLWADRVYQLVLVVLAPFFLVGVGQSFRWLRAVPGVNRRLGTRSPLAVVVVVLVVLLLVNSGAAFAVAGTADTAAFNSDANDLAFDNRERAGAGWLTVHANVTESATDPDSRGRVDDPAQVQIYADPLTAQMFRSELRADETTADVVLLKSKWRPEFDGDRVEDGYVYVRRPAVENGAAGERVSPTVITERNASALSVGGNQVYDNGVVSLVERGNASG